ncbi:MAG TPA: dephospho-CoA kinase [Acidobacteriaceae bacterium]|jgi:dephospho-CoA kinase|nr:dephospho-CoA kinase [Acidobacteriaceae bacterium]
MLRVGLTGGLGSGKSTVAAMFAARGIALLEADAIGRELMQPGQPVYAAILQRFSGIPELPSLVRPNGQLDRAALARYVFSTGRIDELSHIVHPPVVAEQERRAHEIFARDPNAIVMVESALIFEADRAGTASGLRKRFDQLILVTAPESLKISRYIARVSQGRPLTPQERSSIEADALRRMAAQMPDAEKVPFCNYVIDNSGPCEQTEAAVERIFQSWHR